MAARSASAPVPPILVRPKEAARRLSISLSNLYLLKDRGKIAFRKLGAASMILVADLEALAASLPAFEPDMDSTDPLLPYDRQQLAIERANEPRPKRERGRLRRPWPEPPAEPEPPTAPPAPAEMESTGPLLPADQQELAAKCGRGEPPPPPEPDFVAIYESRRKLLIGNVGPDEARLRSFEFTVNAYRAHFGADLESAKQAVTAAIAPREAAARPKEKARNDGRAAW